MQVLNSRFGSRGRLYRLIHVIINPARPFNTNYHGRRHTIFAVSSPLFYNFYLRPEKIFCFKPSFIKLRQQGRLLTTNLENEQVVSVICSVFYHFLLLLSSSALPFQRHYLFICRNIPHQTFSLHHPMQGG